MANDTFSIIVDYKAKTARYVGILSVKNTFSVFVSNIDDSTDVNLALQIQLNKEVYASIEVGDFTASGTGATGTLSLNTQALLDYFESLPDQAKMSFTVIVVDTVGEDTIINDTVLIMNNPYNASALAPDAAGYGVAVESLPTVVGEVSVWATIAGVLSATGYAIETTLAGAVTKLVRADAIKAVTDALATAVGLNTTHRTGDGSDHADVASNTADIATNVSDIAANDAAMLKRADADFAVGITEKAAPVLADRVLLESASNSWKKYWALISTIQNTGAVADASNVLTSIVNFDNLLSAADDNVQKALDTLNDVIAEDMIVDASGFSGNLSGADVNSQLAFDTIDAMTLGNDTYDYYVTAGDWADLVQALESGTYATIYVPDGTYTCTDNEATPLDTHANVTRIDGESRDGVIFDADGTTNGSITNFLALNPETIISNISITGLPATGAIYAFSGSYTGVSYSYPNLITRAVNCQVIAPDGGGNSNCFAFRMVSANNCFVDGDSKIGGFTYCTDTTDCRTLDCITGFVYCYGISACTSSSGVGTGTGFSTCYSVSSCYTNYLATGFQGCNSISSSYARICRSNGFLSCRGMSACGVQANAGDGIPFNSCINLDYSCTLTAGTKTPVYSNCTFNATYKDNTDNTKELTHDYSAIATGTERVATWPDKDGTIAMLSDVGGGGGMSANKLTAKNLYGGI